MATIYVDPAAPTNGDGSFESPFNTWVGMSYTSSNLYLQKEQTTWAGSASITLGANTVTLGTYEAATGDQIQDNTRHAKIRNTAGHGINTSTRTGCVIDNLDIQGANVASSNAILCQYTNSSTTLNLTIRRCILDAQASGQAAITARGAGLTITDTVATSAATATACFALTVETVTIDGCDVSHSAGTAISISTTAADETTAVNATITNTTVNSTGDGLTTGDGLFVRGKNVTIRNVTSQSAWDNAIFVRGQNISITECNLSGFDGQRGDGDGIQLAGTHDVITVTIADNRIIGHTDDAVKYCIIAGENGAVASTGAVRIVRNVTFGMDICILCSIPGGVIYDNECTQPDGSGIAIQGDDCIVMGNMIQRTGGRGISVATGFTGVVIRNNTVIGHAGSGIGVEDSTATIVNNVLIRSAGSSAAFILEQSATCTIANNIYHAPDGTPLWTWDDVEYTTFAAWQAASSQDASPSSYEDPLLSGGGVPTSASPCVGEGSYLATGFHRGGKRMSVVSPDIGAYRYFSPRTART